MTLIRRPQRFSELMSLPSAMDRMFEEWFTRPRTWFERELEPLVPALDIHSAPDAYVVEASLPGLRPEDVDVTIEGDVLTIKSEHKEEEHREEAGWILREMHRGAFTRSVTLPAGLKAESAKATFRDGVLRLEIPKAEATKPKHLTIETK